MSHSERLPECVAFQCGIENEFKEHVKESVPVRRDVDIAKSQVTTLMQANGAVMQDIKDIKEDVAQLRSDILGLKIWILSGVIGTAIVFAIPTFSMMNRQGAMGEKIDRLERLHPYGSPLAPVMGTR